MLIKIKFIRVMRQHFQILTLKNYQTGGGGPRLVGALPPFGLN